MSFNIGSPVFLRHTVVFVYTVVIINYILLAQKKI